MSIDWGLVLGAVGVVGIPVAIGLTMAASTPGEFRFVRGCFITAAVLTIGSLAWLTYEQDLGLAKIAIAGVVGAVVAIGLVVALEWVNRKQAEVKPFVSPVTPAPTVAPAIERPDVTLRFVFAESPAIQLINQSDKLAREIKWTLVLWNLDNPKVYSNPTAPDMADKHEPLPFPTSTFDYIRPKSNSGPLNIFNSPFVAPHAKPGDRLIGSASVVCPDCERGHTFVVYITLGKGGWYHEIKDEKSGDIIIPTRLTRQSVIEYFNVLMARIPEHERTPITDLF